MAETTFFSGEGDGEARYTTESDWDTAHDTGTGTEKADQGVKSDQGAQAELFSGAYYITRIFYPFDTSAIDSGDVVSAATLSFYESRGMVQNDDTIDAVLVETTQPDHTVLATSDYGKCGSIFTPDEIGEIALSAISTNAYNAITIDDLTAIKVSGAASTCGTALTGWSCIGMRNSRDVDDSAPSGGNYFGTYFSEQTGTGNDPKLVVTHAAVTNIKSVNGLAVASIKSVNGLAIASTKSINGLE